MRREVKKRKCLHPDIAVVLLTKNGSSEGEGEGEGPSDDRRGRGRLGRKKIEGNIEEKRSGSVSRSGSDQKSIFF